MKSNPFFDFTVDKDTATVYVVRDFNAPVTLVWKAWTEAVLLDQWWAPKPYKAVTKSQEFRVGGTWLYAMVGPSGDKHWAKAEYTVIEVDRLIEWIDAFCDEKGNSNTGKPNSHWRIEFHQSNENTQVRVTLKHDRLEDLKKQLKMGFQEGFTAALGNLDELLENQR